MESPGTSLGVFPSAEHTDFVFGGGSEVIGLRLEFSSGLQRAESHAEQALDFIQQLYTSQSLRGEHFAEINLGILASNFSAETAPAELDYVELLSEQLQQWILSLSEFITLSHFDETSTNAQKEHLRFCSLMPVSLQNDETGLADAYSLWSFAYPESPESIQPGGFQVYDPVDYEDLDFGKSAEHLQRYKSGLVEKYNAVKFTNYEIEAKKHYLIKKLKDVTSSKYELLADQERLLELLEQESNTSEKKIVPNTDEVVPKIETPAELPQHIEMPQGIELPNLVQRAASTAPDVGPGGVNGVNQNFLRKRSEAPGKYTVPTLDSEVPGDFLSSPAVVYQAAPTIALDKNLRTNRKSVIVAEAWLFRAVAFSAVAGLFYVLKNF